MSLNILSARKSLIVLSSVISSIVATVTYVARTNPFKGGGKVLLLRLFTLIAKRDHLLSPRDGPVFCPLIQKKTLVEGIPGKICPVRVFTFGLPKKTDILKETVFLGLGHVIKLHEAHGKNLGNKSYSPTDVSRSGVFDLTVKIYPDGHNSQILDALRVGDAVGMSGPWPLDYMCAARSPGGQVNLVAFGVGITEAYHVARAELELPDFPAVGLLYANRYAEDALFRQELEELGARYPDRFKLTRIYSRDVVEGALHGRISGDNLRQVFDLSAERGSKKHAEQRFVVAGSREMIQQTWKQLKALGYSRENHLLLLLSIVGNRKRKSEYFGP